MEKKVAFALLRVSTPEQSLESQESALLAIAADKGYTIPEKYRFREKKTGYDEQGVDRQSIIDLRNSIGLHKPEAIFILELSRLTRNGLKVYDYIKEFSLTPKIPMYFADFDMWTLNTDTKEELRENIFKLVGAGESVENERKRITARTKRGKAAAAAKGLFAGHLSDGYRVERNEKGEKIIVPDEERAPIIKRVFELYREYSVRQIRDILNNENVLAPGKYRLHSPLFVGYKKEYDDKTHDRKKREDLTWTTYNIENILGNEWYIGIRRYNGIEHHIEPLVSQELWAFAQAKKAQHPVNPKTGQNVFLLSGLLYCGNCGRKMYGHYVGYANHYYCSSLESGADCNARGISKENVEGIVKKIVMTRLLVDASVRAESPVNDILSMDKKLKKEYQGKIKIFKSIIIRNGESIEDLKRQMRVAISEKLKASEVQVPVYEDVIASLESQIIERQKNTTGYEREIARLEAAIARANTAKKMTERLQNASMEEIKEYFNIVINRAYLYNVGKTTSVVRVNYNVGFYDEFIYSSQRHKGKYFPLGALPLGANVDVLPEGIRDIWWKTTHDVKYQQQGQSQLTTLTYNPDNKLITFNEYQTLCFNDNTGFFVITDALNRIKEFCHENGVTWDFYEINHAVSVPTYLRIFEKVEKAVRDYEKIEGLSARAKELQNRAKEYRKKYNTGKPTCEPYITKDEMYAAVQIERKRLYNRVYKIKNNKSISEGDKKILIGDIRKRLHDLKYKINYFGDSIRARKYTILKNEE